MNDIRTEMASLGSIDVPADRLWGTPTQRSLQHFRRLAHRKLKPLPLDPFRHQDSAIAPGQPVAFRYLLTAFKIVASGIHRPRRPGPVADVTSAAGLVSRISAA